MESLTLVLLPGLDGTGDLFEPLVAAMGPGIKSVVVRYPITGPQSYQELEAFARQSLPADEPFVLLGESFSGPIAISIASEPPANLLATVLCATFASCPQPRLTPLRWLLPLANHHLAPVALISALLMGRHSTPALESTLHASLTKLPAAIFRTRLKAVVEVNVQAKLATVKNPLLYLQALEDRLVPAEATAAVQRANPKIKVTQLKGPHFLLQACPNEAAKAIGSFLVALNTGTITTHLSLVQTEETGQLFGC